jgi:hypothetical protein
MLGRDKIIGLDDLSILSLQLRSILMSLNISSLAHLKLETVAFPLPDRWLHSSDLALGGPSALELDTFTAAVKCTGLSLTEGRDTLTWVGGDGSGLVTAKNVYTSLLPDRETDVQPLWLTRIWSWQLPLKFKLFLWLGASDKLLTWENLQRKADKVLGFVFCAEQPRRLYTIYFYIVPLPNRSGCTSCNIYLFPFIGLVPHFRSASPPGPLPWLRLLHWQYMSAGIFGLSVISHSLRTLPLPFGLSATELFPPSTGSSLLSSLSFTKQSILSWPAGHTVAFFDGAAKSSGLCCGAGGIFKMHQKRTTKWFLSCGRGSNTKAELLGLWATLLLASNWSLDHFQVIGDSKVIIDWINCKCDSIRAM